MTRKTKESWDDLCMPWSDAEKEAIRALSDEQDLPVNGVLRQALRHYQMHIARLKAGETVHWSGDEARARAFAGPLLDEKPVEDERSVETRTFIARREYGPHHDPMIGGTYGGKWVVRDETGAFVDWDQYSNDLRDRYLGLIVIRD